ncbi:RNase H domain-containing protein [Trichonephila clavipes]|nr:RNase H domain-containing protein [Trichonephila clavipes]
MLKRILLTQSYENFSILSKLKQVSSSCDVHFQWIPSHVDIWGNEEADALAEEGAREAMAAFDSLAYLELYSAVNI